MWKSNLLKDGPKIDSLLKSLNGDCHNKGANGKCTALVPTQDEIEAFISAYEKVDSNQEVVEQRPGWNCRGNSFNKEGK